MSTAPCPTCHGDYATTKAGTIRKHPCKPPTVRTIAIPYAKPVLTKNEVRRTHHHTEARHRRDALATIRWAIRAAHLPLIPYADVDLHWRMPNRVHRDGDSAQWMLSVCLDALTQEGVLHDDSWICVRHSGVTTHPPLAGMPGGMWLTVQPAKEDDDAA